MNKLLKKTRQPEQTRRKIVEATMGLVLRQGFSATGVDGICKVAGVTKGAFFHHFSSKDDAGLAALAAWGAHGMALYAQAVEKPAVHPLDHLHRFFDIMISFAGGAGDPLTCVVGMISQESAISNEVLRKACSSHLTVWNEFVRKLLMEAKKKQKPRVDFDPDEVAWFLNGLWQGSMLVAKTTQDPQVVVRNLQRARDYVDGLFGIPASQEKKTKRRNK